jgi:hypothetical protein
MFSNKMIKKRAVHRRAENSRVESMNMTMNMKMNMNMNTTLPNLASMRLAPPEVQAYGPSINMDLLNQDADGDPPLGSPEYYEREAAEHTRRETEERNRRESLSPEERLLEDIETFKAHVLRVIAQIETIIHEGGQNERLSRIIDRLAEMYDRDLNSSDNDDPSDITAPLTSLDTELEDAKGFLQMYINNLCRMNDIDLDPEDLE